jgi:hypothetical protein
MSYRITLRSRDGTERVEHDSNLERATAYFRLSFCSDSIRQSTILHCLRQTGSYSHSYNGGMARIEREVVK